MYNEKEQGKMQNIEIIENKKILIIAPHPDDEVFCCGGILMNYAKQCDVVLLTYGEKGNPGWSERMIADIRMKEFRNVMKCLNIHKYFELKLPDGSVKEKIRILRKIPLEQYDYIFLPNRYDIHVDHRCVYKIVNKEVHKRKSSASIYEYEMWGMLQNPSHYIDITNKIQEKKNLMKLYKSQEMYIDYCNRILALNYYRAIEVPNTGYIECFYKESRDIDFNIRLWVRKRIKNLYTFMVMGNMGKRH